MFQVIGTREDGAVVSSRECEDVAEVIAYVAGQLTHSEEDVAVAVDVLSDYWSTMDPEQRGDYEEIAFHRAGYKTRYGLIEVKPYTCTGMAIQ